MDQRPEERPRPFGQRRAQENLQPRPGPALGPHHAGALTPKFQPPEL